MKKISKILSVIFLVLALGLMTYLSVGLKNGSDYKINLISLEGNIHLSKEQYLSYANLLDKNNYEKLTLQIVKDRIEKHPYVQRADVRYDGDNKVSIRITEKTFESILIDSSNQYIVTENLQLLPFFPQTKKIDYPIISNPTIAGALKVLSSLKRNNDIVSASKIITTIKLLNPDLYDRLSSIDMQNGKDVVLSFTSLNYPVIIGRGSEIKKVIYFNNFWTYLKGKEINNYMDYVDLRFGGRAFLGIVDSLKREEQNIKEGQKKS